MSSMASTRSTSPASPDSHERPKSVHGGSVFGFVKRNSIAGDRGDRLSRSMKRAYGPLPRHFRDLPEPPPVDTCAGLSVAASTNEADDRLARSAHGGSLHRDLDAVGRRSAPSSTHGGIAFGADAMARIAPPPAAVSLTLRVDVGGTADSGHQGATLRNARFSSGVRFTGASIEGTDFTGATGIEPSAFAGATGTAIGFATPPPGGGLGPAGLPVRRE